MNARQRRLFRPALETLEARCVPAIFTVDTVEVDLTPVNGRFSFEEAVIAAFNNPGPHTINFNIPGTGPHIIKPRIPNGSYSGFTGVTINGFSQPGSSPNTLANGNNAVIMIEIPNRIYLDGSGNTVTGLAFKGVDIGGNANTIQGNYLGLKANGKSFGDNQEGVAIGNPFSVSSSSNTIGGTRPQDRNVISGHSSELGNGITIFQGSSNVIQGNFIGTDVTGTLPLGNESGVVIANNANTNYTIIGGAAAGAANVIAFNREDGVRVEGGTGQLIRANSIFSNGRSGTGVGIFLRPGANNNMPAPTLKSAGLQDVIGTMVGAANTTYRLEFFVNSRTNPAGNYEGETFFGFLNVTTGADGRRDFQFDALIPPGGFVTATAADVDRNTSMFSDAVKVEPGCRMTFDSGTGIFDIQGTPLRDSVRVTTKAVKAKCGNQPAQSRKLPATVVHIVFRGDDGDDLFQNDGLKDASAFGEGGDDVLRGGLGDDRLEGGPGKDGLFGDLGDDDLTGGPDADRFLFLSNDSLTDRVTEDAKINFVDGTAATACGGTATPGKWTALDVFKVDVALDALHARTNNTTLLKTSDGQELTFERYFKLSNARGCNNNLGRIAFSNDSFGNYHIIFHEIGHNWDSPGDSSAATDFQALSGWKDSRPTDGSGNPDSAFVRAVDAKDNPTGWWYYAPKERPTAPNPNAPRALWPAQFGRAYSRTTPYEDYADAFSAYFLLLRGERGPVDAREIPDKIAAIDSFLDSLTTLV